MKEVVNTRQELVTYTDRVYVADDGTEFEYEWKCKEYEKELREKKAENVKHCKHLDGYANFDGMEYMECNSYRWYKPESEEDIEILNKAFFDYGAYSDNIDESYIGEWICIEETDDGDAYISTLEQGINYARKILSALGYEMIITEKETK